jgi:uncharacterized protein (TIGR00255 family)
MTIRSMTAFASAERDCEGWVLVWEVRSVNHRYLDVALRLPEPLRFIEADARNRIGAFVKRGRLDVSLALKKTALGEMGLQLDLELVRSLLATAREIETLIGQSLAGFSALDLLKWPGVLHEAEADRDRIAPGAFEVLDEAMAKIIAARETEGRQLAELVETRCRQIREQVACARQRLPEVLAAIRQKMLARLAEVSAKPDADRLEQEMVYWAQKLDVAEELDRLDSHLDEVLRTLEQNQPAGRRLDFLLQEMNREANTLGSKSADAQTTRASVEMKVLIEQMREQIQNIE